MVESSLRTYSFEDYRNIDAYNHARKNTKFGIVKSSTSSVLNPSLSSGNRSSTTGMFSRNDPTVSNQQSIISKHTLPGFNPSSLPISNNTSNPNPSPNPQTDRRIRIKAKTQAAASRVYGPASTNNILSIFHSTNGVIFPYTPIMNVNFTAEWAPYQLTHTNYQTQAFSRHAIEDITISGQFTAQNEEEAFYTFASMHFFRTLTKMYFGRNDPLAGATPPVLALSGYGNGMFNEIPVVIKGFSQEFSDTVDMVEVRFNGGKGNAWVPTLTNLIVQLGVSHDLKRVRDEFNLDDFRTGKLLTDNRGFM